MSTLPTVTIQTGPDTFITVNETDYEAFKSMEYIPPKYTKKPEPEIILEPEVTTPKKRTPSGD